MSGNIIYGDVYTGEAVDTFAVTNLNWISGKRPEKTNLQVKVRHGEKIYQAEITWTSNVQVEVKLDGKDQGIASGQFAVFYDGEYPFVRLLSISTNIIINIFGIQENHSNKISEEELIAVLKNARNE